MRCTSCDTENAASAKFCEGCGAPVVRSCPKCGVAQSATARFCPECGSALLVTGAGTPAVPGTAASAATAPAPQVVAERRVCSVLFCDLVGFTTLSESRDPEEVRELLSRYFEVARRTVTRYGGIVEKFIGDAVMAVWGTPVSQEGDTERSVRAALDLVDAVAVLGQEAGTPGLAARAGVVTDEVAVTLGAQDQGMVAGDAVNTASRVQAAAQAGTVLVDEATRKLSEPAITFSDEGAFSLKGKAEPIPLFSAARVVSGVGGKQRAGGLEAPVTGRDAELRGLKDLFHTCVERNAPRLVVVTGPAGVGKSRLGWELEKYIDGLADTVLWHRGRCLSYGEGVAFWALAEIVRQRFGIKEEDPQETAEAKLCEGMVRFVPDDGERAYVGVRLARLLGVSYPSETKAVLTQDELFAGWRLFFGHLAKVAPVALVVEDAQHADEGLLGFVDHLIDWTRDLPVFVLLFARPGSEAIDLGYGMGRNRSTLSLDPLDAASMAALVEGLVPGMPTGARDVIIERAQGIALFAVETVRSLIDQRVVQKDADSYRLVGDLGTLSVPD
ncbi:MAG: adenylate/guanylate cyclase domain-containing protein, partial [Acidimicrobiales bacterium]